MVSLSLRRLWEYSKSDSLVRDNFILLAATMMVNLGAFLFHIVMGRFLGPSSYGILGVILAIIYILSIPVNSIQTIITKFVSQLNSNKEYNKINFLLRRSLLKLGYIGLFALVIFIILIPPISTFLHIPKINLLILSPIILFATLGPIVKGGLQGLQKFKALGINMITEIIVKLGLGILLVYTVLGLNGTILAIVLSALVTILLGLIQLKKFLNKKYSEYFDPKEVYKYSYPVIFILTFLMLIFSIDLFLVKHFFSSDNAGLYAAASLIGKIIFFASFSISQVMFPKSVDNFNKRKSNIKIIKKSMLLTLILAIPAIIIYFLVPTLIIKILFGQGYTEISHLIGFFGVAMTFFSLSYMLALYNLSINKTNFVIPLIIATIVEIIAISFIHSSLLQVTLIVTLVMFLVFIYSFIYTTRNLKWLNSQ